MFSCEFGEIFKDTFFTEHLWATASVYLVLLFLHLLFTCPTRPSALHVPVTYVSRVQRVLVPHMPTAPTCPVSYVLRVLHVHMPYVSHALRVRVSSSFLLSYVTVLSLTLR